jgi:ATP-binding protein involved in chromosome partitioning
MKIAVPVDGERLCSHFGHSPQFAFFEVDPAGGGILGREDLAAPEHQPGVLPRWLSAQGANVVIAGGMGGPARDLLLAQQVDVIMGAPEDDPQALVTAYLAGALTGGGNTCTGHDHDHEHGHTCHD